MTSQHKPGVTEALRLLDDLQIELELVTQERSILKQQLAEWKATAREIIEMNDRPIDPFAKDPEPDDA